MRLCEEDEGPPFLSTDVFAYVILCIVNGGIRLSLDDLEVIKAIKEHRNRDEMIVGLCEDLLRERT